ncbi:MAG: hypothetical protein AAFR61_21315 [Bacteroidota bacterium]
MILQPTYSFSFCCLFIAVAVGLTAAFGAAVADYIPAVSSTVGAGQMLLIAGSGWVLEMLLGTNASDTQRRYFALLSETMVVGVCILIPFCMIQLLAGPVWLGWPIISVLLSSTTMTYLHYAGIQQIGLSPRLTLRWFFSLQSTALAWICFFYLL